ncbi:MAG: HAMP domain-containing histidine kinase [Bacteroidales bacterium]|nr:HAMP domain-containing histidine kinase [Bacteroidales bacterium]
MKKRLIVSLFFVVIVTTFFLILSIFKLYTEAEKVQRSIFVNEVLTAGNNVVDQIDAILKNDTLMPVADTTIAESIDTSDVVSVQHSRKFLLDSVKNQPIGVIMTEIYIKEDNARVVSSDTTYFSESFRMLFPLYKDPWSPKSQDEIPNSFLEKVDVNMVQLDSTTKDILNPSFLKDLIKEALEEETIEAKFDFALYNAFTTEFVVEPSSMPREKMLQSDYVFRLKYNEKVSSPHYIILYFPGERGIFLQRMSTIVMMILILVFLVSTISFVSLYSLYRQKKVSEVTNEFVDNMTHEFKTPISTISLACEALNDEETLSNPEIQKTYVQIIGDENERLRSMVTNILQIAQLKKGQIKMNVELLDMHELVHKVVDSVALLVNTHNGILNLALNADNCKIFGDKEHLTNVLVNLVENAVKYSEGKPEILINTLSNDKYFMLSVTDKGIGIPKKSLPEIFSNFYRVPSGNVHNVKGYGLGLGYVKRIVTLHKGKIEVESIEGKGSTFMISLPFKK